MLLEGIRSENRRPRFFFTLCEEFKNLTREMWIGVEMINKRRYKIKAQKTPGGCFQGVENSDRDEMNLATTWCVIRQSFLYAV
jgi:hypothetical protein